MLKPGSKSVSRTRWLSECLTVMNSLILLVIAFLLMAAGCQNRAGQAIEIANEADKTDNPIAYIMALEVDDRMKLMAVSETESKPKEPYEGWQESMAAAKASIRQVATDGTDEEVRAMIIAMQGSR